MNQPTENNIKILREAGQLFMKFGFKSITMDDVARELGISKKTLYTHFVDKTELVTKTLRQHIDDQKNDCHCIEQSKPDPITYMLNITDTVSERFRQMNPGVLYDLKKYFKPAWDELTQFKSEFIFNQITKNLEQGKAKGLYLKDIHVKLIASIYVHLVDFLINQELHTHTSESFREMYLEIIKYHLRAICTEKGLKILNEKLKEKQ